MVATNSVAERTGNVSAGTSVFAMIVLEKALSKLYPEIDMVTTPTGKPVAMVHSNNCTSDLNAWVGLFQEFTQALGVEISQSRLFEMLYQKALTGDADAGGLLAYTYLAVRLPGASDYLKMGGFSGMIGVVMLGAALGLGAAILWQRLVMGSTKRPG